MSQFTSLALDYVILLPQARLWLLLSGAFFLGSFLLAREGGVICRWSLEFLQPGRAWAHLPCVLQVELGRRPSVERGPPVTEEEWTRHVGPEGRLQHVPELKNRIFSGVSVSNVGWGGGWPGRSLLTCFIAPPGSQPWPAAGGLEIPPGIP